MCKVWTNVFKLPRNKATLSGLLAKLTNNNQYILNVSLTELEISL